MCLGFRGISSAHMERLLSFVSAEWPRATSSSHSDERRDLALISRRIIPEPFLAQLSTCGSLFAQASSAVITRNVALFAHMTSQQREQIE